MLRRYLQLLTFLIVLSVCARAESGRRAVEVPLTSTPPTLDHFIQAVPREAEISISDFKQRKPGDGIPISESTSVHLSYDRNNLYVIFVCDDQPDQIRGHLTRRDYLGSDDRVAVYIDSLNDHRRAHAFIVNPLGVQMDGIVTEGRGFDIAFDGDWYSEGRLTASGFIVRFSIPFRNLRFPGSGSQTWGLALERTISRKGESAFWPHISNRTDGFVQQFGLLKITGEITRGERFELSPYGSITAARLLDGVRPSGRYRSISEPRAGFDAKLVINDALTVDATVNPDFSHLESDEPQVTINQRYEVLYPEKRPFFLESSEYFRTQKELFFSRRIVDPDYGVRVTGQANQWVFGTLLAHDRAHSVGSVPIAESGASIAVFRLQRQLGKQSDAGFLMLSRSSAERSNRVFSFDTRLRVNETLGVSAQLAQSSVDSGLEVKRGVAGLFAVDHRGRNLTYHGRYVDRSPDFQSDLGFLPRTDIRQVEQSASYEWLREKAPLLSFGPTVSATATWNHRNQIEDWDVTASFEFELIGQTFIEIEQTESFERFEGSAFRQRERSIFATSSPSKLVSASALHSWGSRINYFPPEGLSPFLCNSTDGFLSVTFNPTVRFQVNQTYLYSRLDTDGNAKVFSNDILRSKLNYQLSERFSIRAIVEYASTIVDPSRVSFRSSKRLTPEILLMYALKADATVYAGYVSRLENVAPQLTLASSTQVGSPAFRVTGHQLLLKARYSFRF